MLLTPKKVKLKYWPLGKKFNAITIVPFIFYRDELDAETLRYELVHFDQVKRLGWIRFYLTYIWYSIRYGYRNNPFEKEAYEKHNGH